MAAPIVEALEQTVFVNSTIPVTELFTVSDSDNDVVSYFFDDFQSRAASGYFTKDGIPLDNGAEFSVAADEIGSVLYVGGPSITFEGFRVIAIDSEGNRSNSQAIGRIYSTRANNSAPHTQQPDFTVLANESIPASSFISAHDPDGFPIQRYRITEGSKVLNLESENGFVTVTSYLHHFRSGDSITIRGADQGAFNGTFNVNVLDQHRFRFPLAVADQTASGSIIASFNGEGNFVLNGVDLPIGVPIEVTADQLPQLQYTAVGPDRVSNYHVTAFDGELWSFEKRGLITTRINANRPVVQFARATTPADQPLGLDGLFEVFDADQNTQKKYRVFNTSPHAQNGDLFLFGQKIPRVAWFELTADQLPGLTFQTPRIGFDQQIRIISFDGKFWSAPSTLSISSTEPIIRPEIDSVDSPIVIEQQQTIPVASLFSQTDVGPGHTRYQVYEPSIEANSGQLRIGPTPQAANEIHEISNFAFNAALNFRSGDFFNRHVDTVYARASNGQFDDWSPWEKIDIHTEPEIEDGLTGGLDWTMFLPRNSAGKIEISYSFMQQFPDYETGDATNGGAPEHFEVFNEAQRVTTRLWLRHAEEFMNVQFVEVSDSEFNIFGQLGGIIRMGEYGDTADDRASAFAFFPNNAFPSAGDMWFNRIEGFQNGFNEDTFDGLIFMHELGHALGLKHPFTGTPRLPEESNVNLLTVMSYTTQNVVNFEPFFLDDRQPGSFGLYDMYELQQIYGANTDFNAGDTTYSIARTWQRDLFNETIWDGGGNDTLSSVGSSGDTVVDLRQGQQSSIGAGPLFTQTFDIGDYKNNVTIAYGAEIENAIGSAHNDTLIGNELDNVILGLGGDDMLMGGIGADFLAGGAGNDSYLWGVGDHNDIVNEQGNGDALDQISIGFFPTLNSLSEDFRFRLEGSDLLVDLQLDGGPVDNTLRIKNQTLGDSQVETLIVRGVRVDLVDLVNQVSLGVNRFTTTGNSSSNGALVVPV